MPCSSIASRSSGVKSRLLDTLTPTATTTSSKRRRGAADDVEVPVGDRVEGPGADGSAHQVSWVSSGGRGGVTVPKHRLAVALACACPSMPSGQVGSRTARRALDHDHGARDQPAQLRRAARSRTDRASSTSGYGGSQEHHVVAASRWPARERRRDRARPPRPPARSRARVALSPISRAVRRSDSTSVTTPAPRDQASSPTRARAGVEVEEAQALQGAAPRLDGGEQRLAHPVAGRPGRWPAGSVSRRPPAVPPMIRVTTCP